QGKPDVVRAFFRRTGSRVGGLCSLPCSCSLPQDPHLHIPRWFAGFGLLLHSRRTRAGFCATGDRPRGEACPEIDYPYPSREHTGTALLTVIGSVRFPL